MRVSTGCLHRPSLGTPSANVSEPSATGSHKCLMKRETYALQREGKRVREHIYRNEQLFMYALFFFIFQSFRGFPFRLPESLLISVSYLNSFSLLPRRSRTSHWQEKASWEGIPHLITAFRKAFLWRVLKPNTYNTHTVYPGFFFITQTTN